MINILKYLTDYLRENKRIRLHILLAILLTAAFTYNYTHDFKRTTIDGFSGSWRILPAYFTFYAVPYIGTLLLTVAGTPEARLLKNRRLWWVIGIMLIALVLCRMALKLPEQLIIHCDYNRYERYYWQRNLSNIIRVITLVGTVWLFKRFWDRDTAGLYGMRRQGFAWRPYFFMLLIMVPPIIWASFQPSFQKTYPILRPVVLKHLEGWTPNTAFAVHEFFYALRFIGVEVWFRGFLVLGMVRYLGRATLLPMVVLYAFWHFGKPMPEALGAIFGSYILGIIALRSGRINGGIVLHMGINVLMNLAAYLQWVLR